MTLKNLENVASSRTEHAYLFSKGAPVTPERYQQVVDLFKIVCELEPDERAKVLAQRCADDSDLRTEVESLLATDSHGTDFLEISALRRAFVSEPDDDLNLPESIGRYEIMEVIALGGMGIVYKARQEAPSRIVALKVMRRGVLGAGARRRFEYESQILGRLHHPAIAQIYESGTHKEGHHSYPFFAMEYIQGATLIDHVQDHDLTTVERINVFLQVCDGVQFAHQQGVMHRDIKPANILVDEYGQPKILDFGIAKAIGEDLYATIQTSAGQLIGTIAYMSPEQIAADPAAIDLRTDVYSLGAVLYEMLSGRPVRDLADRPITEALRQIERESITPLRTVAPHLRGDLDTIVAKALATEPDHRYASAAELGADLRRYLNHEPITARQPTTLYQLRKLARRHPTFAISGVVFILMLAAASIVSLSFAFNAEKRRQEAEQMRAEADSVSRFLLDVFLGSPDKDQISRTELLTRAEKRLLEEPPTDPRIEATIREYIGHGFHKLNHVQRAEPHLARALEIRRKLGAVDEALVQSLTLLGMQRVVQGEVEQASALFAEALEHRRNLLGPDHMVNDPAGELLYFSKIYVPDAPEVAQDAARRQALAQDAAASLIPIQDSFDAPLQLQENFEGPELAGSWNVTLIDITECEYQVADGYLRVHAFKQTPDPSQENKNGFVFFLQELEMPLGDFRLEAQIRWDNDGRLQTTQSCGVELFSEARQAVCYMMYTDGWIAANGGRSARIGNDSANEVIASTGANTMPDSGTATITIQRRADRISIFWNGKEFLRGLDAKPLFAVRLVAGTNFYDGADGKTTFGNGVAFGPIRLWGNPHSSETENALDE